MHPNSHPTHQTAPRVQGSPPQRRLVHDANEVVDEVLPAACLATLDEVQPLLVQTTLRTNRYS